MKKFLCLLLPSLLVFTTIILAQPPIVMVANQFLDYNLNARVAGTGGITTVASPLYPETGLINNAALLCGDQRHFTVNSSSATILRLDDQNTQCHELTGSFAFDAKNASGISLSYFDFGNINWVSFIDPEGFTSIKSYSLSAKVAYSHSFGKGTAIGGALKYCRSDFGHPYLGYGNTIKAMNSFAADICFSYAKTSKLSNLGSLGLNIGIMVTDLGTKVKFGFGTGYNKVFQPSTLSAGLLLTPEFRLPAKLKIAVDIAFQVEKLLVPSQPKYWVDEEGQYFITSGKDPNVSAFRGLYQSFYDSPQGSKGEIDEIGHHAGSELRLALENRCYVAIRYGQSNRHQPQGYYSSRAGGLGIGLYGFYLDYFQVFDTYGTNNFVQKNYGFSLGFRGNLSGKMFRF